MTSRKVDVWRFSLDAPVQATLARYLDRDPGSLEFEYGPYGKPSLVDGDGLEFSWARSGGVGVLAVARGRAVGIDVERIEPRRAPEERVLIVEADAGECCVTPTRSSTCDRTVLRPWCSARAF